MSRVTAFIDGFNFYHAVDDLKANHLKWVDLWAMCQQFAPEPQYNLTDVLYFSAYATWLPKAYKRHRAFVQAQQHCRVTAVMGAFKAKTQRCRSCGNTWTRHEEKETDVNIALQMVIRARRDLYDRALIVSADSDLAPAVRVVQEEFPSKEIRILTPVGRPHSWDLRNLVGGLANCQNLKRIHLERCLLPETILDARGNTVASRPAKYDPPA